LALIPGARLGPYEVVAPIGAGGMGEVYRAKDTRLNRDVAIKVLPTAFADNPDRRARFEREAQAVAALSHPNVIAIFDTGAHDGHLYVVMELLAGGTLRERLNSGPLSVRKAVDVAVQIARGLGAAHGQGLVHRDLKPENIFLTDDGQVKILDFGLARQTSSVVHSGATETMAATDPGTVMGTVGYMAPEQVRGHAVDARADLFAFGAVLYEMVYGQRAFQRDTAADTMTAILTHDPPDVAGSRPDLSPALDRIIRHCLEKNANERFQSARDVAFALEALSGSQVSTGASGAQAVVAAPAARPWLRYAMAFFLIALAGVAGWFARDRMTMVEPFVSFEQKTWDRWVITNARFGPDGKTIIFSAWVDDAGQVQLFALRPGTLIPQTLNQKSTHLLSVSSKGELAVLTGARPMFHRIFAGTLSRVSLEGTPRPWLQDVTEADWSPDAETLAVIRVVKDNWQLEYPAGHVRYTVHGGYLSDVRVSPDGKQVVFMEHPFVSDDRGTVKLLLANGTTRLLAGDYEGEEGLTWSPDGTSVSFSASSIGNEYEARSVTVNGTPVVRQLPVGLLTVFDTAADGSLLATRSADLVTIQYLAPGAKSEETLTWLDWPDNGKFSADGKQLFFDDESFSAGHDYQVALRDIATKRVVRLGPGGAWGLSPDGRWAGAMVPSTTEIVLYPTGVGKTVHIPRGPIEVYNEAPKWFADSQSIFFCGREKGQDGRCYTQDIAGGPPKPVEKGLDWMASDGKTLLSLAALGKLLQPKDTLLSVPPDARALFVASGDHPLVINRIDVVTGKRTSIRTISCPDVSGPASASNPEWLADNSGYAITCHSGSDVLFVVAPMKDRK
jgi:WD40 repeat protein